MNKFVNAINSKGSARTENQMKAHRKTDNACVDLFFKIGSLRGSNVIPYFVAAFVENKELALRIVQWARDVRGGAGERQIYRDVLLYLEQNEPEAAKLLIEKTPEIGRWDDVLVLNNALKEDATQVYIHALKEGNRLAAKWAPRKGPVANSLRRALGISPKDYRRLVVDNSETVETQMCSKNWNTIDFSHVPSVASKKYRKAFARNAKENYTNWIEALKRGDEGVKVNASAIFPHDIIKEYCVHMGSLTRQAAAEQWKALPNYVGDNKVISMIDVSGSMTWGFEGKSNLQPIHVSLGLGLYTADKNTGPFKDVVLTFSRNSDLVTLRGDIFQKIEQMNLMDWGMNTNLHSAFDRILETAVRGHATEEDMPTTLLILSDMQFDQCVQNDDRAIDMIRRKYENAGYELPKVVFWNLNGRYENVPVTFNEQGVALVSGFSPSILTTILANDMEEFTPYNIMLKAIMNERYALKV